MSEEGISKGVRRIVAVTRGEAMRAMKEAARLKHELEGIAAMSDEQLEKACRAFKEVSCDWKLTVVSYGRNRN